MGKKRFVTAHDIDELLEQGQGQLRVDCDTVVTDVGRERALERGLKIVEDGENRPGPSTPTTPSSASGDPAAVRSQAELTEIVMRVVITHLGSKPANLEAVIAKVLNRP